MCAHLAFSLRIASYKRNERGQRTGVLLTVLAKETAFTFCSLEAECETLMKSDLHLWMAMKRLALFATIEKPCPHTASSKTCPPHHQPASTLCPSLNTLLALLFGGISQRLFHYCVVWPRAPAGSPFISPLWRLSKGSKGTPSTSTHTNSQTHLKLDRVGDAENRQPSETKAVCGDISNISLITIHP